jgi:hypothetical protein
MYMSMVFRADGVPLASRVDYWREIISSVFMPLDLRGEVVPKTPAELRTTEIGPIRFTEAPAKRSSAPPDDRPNPSPSHRPSSPIWTGCWQACANTASSSSLHYWPGRAAGRRSLKPRYGTLLRSG